MAALTSHKATKQKNGTSTEDFSSELVDFVPFKGNPLFAGTGTDTWRPKISRERGYILREGSRWYLWYTGYNKKTLRYLYLRLC